MQHTDRNRQRVSLGPPGNLVGLVPASPAMSTTSLKELKKNYHTRKKYFTKNVQSAIESTQEVHSGWLKARTTIKRWSKVWCQVKPGYLILYTSQEALKKHRLGVVLLSVCQVIKRPTKKEGFCFKLINPFGSSVWARSSTRALMFAQASLTLRVSDNSIGKLWLDALHRCNLSSNLEGCQSIVDENGFTRGARSRRSDDLSDSGDDGNQSVGNFDSLILNHSNSTSDINSIISTFNINNDSFKTPYRPLVNGNFLSHAHQESGTGSKLVMPTTSNNNNSNNNYNPSQSVSNNYSKMVTKFTRYNWKELKLESVEYIESNIEELENAGMHIEEVQDGNKHLLWHLIKQLRPGMDLSKVTLPTFILEPRSFLEKLADYYYHCDILSDAVLIDDPVMRLINIVKWYLSGFYKKPKGPKKPYNPILGERFRCFWEHPKTKSRTFFVAEQVSHHPPISVFHVANRKDGYTITCALLSRSKYTGNSVSAILDGKARLYLNKRNETYTLTMPYANCRGILLGSLCLELGGKVEIECVETRCKCELDFKVASMWAGSDAYNTLTGKILKDNKLTHTLEGHWDRKIDITEKSTNIRSTLWEVTDTVKNSRLKRYTVALKDQDDRESVKLWSRVTAALVDGNQLEATAEKTRLEDMQRKEARERLGAFKPQHFDLSPQGAHDWLYKWQDDRAWNERRDIMQFEDDFRIKTLMMDCDSSSTPLDPNIDLSLSQMSKISPQAKELVVDQNQTSSASLPPKDTRTYSVNESSPKVKLPAGSLLLEEAIKQVTERNKRLEADIALLQRRRSKRMIAFLLTALIIGLISALYRHAS